VVSIIYFKRLERGVGDAGDLMKSCTDVENVVNTGHIFIIHYPLSSSMLVIAYL
jgi:hypothetical protein